MGCPEYAVLIAKYLDGALNEDELLVLKRHLVTCVDCRVAVEHYRRLDARLHSLSSIPAPSQVRRDLFNRAETGHIWQTRGFWRRWSIRVVGSLVVVALVVVGLMLQMAISDWLINEEGPRTLVGHYPLQNTSSRQVAYQDREQPWVALGYHSNDAGQGGLTANRLRSIGDVYNVSSAADKSEMVPYSVRFVNVARFYGDATGESISISQLTDWPEFIPSGKWRVIRVVTPDESEIIRVVRDGR